MAMRKLATTLRDHESSLLGHGIDFTSSQLIFSDQHPKGKTMKPPTFLVHTAGDSVGVVVVEGLESGQVLDGCVLDIDEIETLTALDDIPMGHKIAIINILEGDTVIKYGHDIGRASHDIAKGEHVHVHNVKTKRW